MSRRAGFEISRRRLLSGFRVKLPQPFQPRLVQMHWGSRSGNGNTDSSAVGGKGKKEKKKVDVVDDEEVSRLEK